jgi:hypothetical protein
MPPNVVEIVDEKEEKSSRRMGDMLILSAPPSITKVAYSPLTARVVLR